MGNRSALDLFPHAPPELLAEVAKSEGARFKAMSPARREHYLRFYGLVWLSLLPEDRQRQLGLRP